jgi:glutamate--cysteine ligase
VREVAREALAIAEGGLDRRNRLDEVGRSESRYLAPLQTILDRGRTAAEDLIDRFNGPWNRSVDPAFKECAY